MFTEKNIVIIETTCTDDKDKIKQKCLTKNKKAAVDYLQKTGLGFMVRLLYIEKRKS